MIGAATPSLTVVGGLAELTPTLLPDLGRRHVSSLEEVALVPTSAVVIDLRAIDILTVRTWLATSRSDFDAPIVLVTDAHEEPSLDVDDVILLPTPPKVLARRLRLVVDLGRTRASVMHLAHTLDEHQTFARSILDGVDVGIVTTDLSGAITFANRRSRELLCLEGDVTDLDVTALLGLERRPDELLQDEPRRLLAYAFATTEGVELDLELSLSRGDGSRDARAGFFLIFRDVRLDKEREAERRRFEHLAAMGTMVAGFAHEVRNPVAALRSIAEELGEELTAAGLALPHAKRMLVVLERIERLVRTSLKFGRPAAPRRAAHRPWTICSAALTGISARVIPSGHPIRIEVEPDLPDVFVDDAQIAQALVILLDNALDAAGSPRGVLLRVARDRLLDAVRFEVIDDGVGIAPADLSRIFDPFFTTKATGTGLGLSIAEQVVRENGGRLEVSAIRGSPTCFSVVITSRPGPPSEIETP